MPTATRSRAKGKVKAKSKAKTQAVSQTAALAVARGLTTMCLHSVAFGRGIFPQGAFSKTRAEGLGLDVYKLDASFSAEAARLVAWVEDGVADALQRRYLRRLLFSVLAPLDETERAKVAAGKPRTLLETFSFCFSYGAKDSQHATIHLALQGDADESAGDGPKVAQDVQEGAAAAQGPNGLPLPSDAKSTKMQCAYMARQLMQLMVTFEEIPANRVLSMKLEYVDETPEEYEPPYFRQEREADLAAFEQGDDVFEMVVGKGVNAGGHLGMTAHVKTVLDPVAIFHNSQKLTQCQQQRTADAGEPEASEEMPDSPASPVLPAAEVALEPPAVDMPTPEAAPPVESILAEASPLSPASPPADGIVAGASPAAPPTALLPAEPPATDTLGESLDLDGGSPDFGCDDTPVEACVEEDDTLKAMESLDLHRMRAAKTPVVAAAAEGSEDPWAEALAPATAPGATQDADATQSLRTAEPAEQELMAIDAAAEAPLAEATHAPRPFVAGRKRSVAQQEEDDEEMDGGWVAKKRGRR